MSLDRHKPPPAGSTIVDFDALGLEMSEDCKKAKLKIAKDVIKLAVGSSACPESAIRLARRYDTEQLKDILFLLESFGAPCE